MSQARKTIWLIVAAFAATISINLIIEVQAAEAARVVVVEIRKFKFVPETLVVDPGDVVVWKNRDIVPHTATSKDGGFHSGRIGAGTEWTIVVTQDMGGAYFCGFHPSMAATIVVGSD